MVSTADDPDAARADASPPTGKRKREEKDDVADLDEDDSCSPEDGPMVGYLNPACTTVTFHDETMRERVALTMVLPSGCNQVLIDYNAAGTYALLTLRWPSEIVDIDKLYEDELKAKTNMSYHLLLMALKRALANHTDVVDRVPSTTISIKLPAPVVTTDRAEKWFSLVNRLG